MAIVEPDILFAPIAREAFEHRSLAEFGFDRKQQLGTDALPLQRRDHCEAPDFDNAVAIAAANRTGDVASHPSHEHGALRNGNENVGTCLDHRRAASASRASARSIVILEPRFLFESALPALRSA